MTRGLYSPDEFRDNCGFGLIAHTSGEASHRLLRTAIESLTCMTHRGGIAADGKTGDGCGLLLQMPEGYMRELAQELFGATLAEQFGIGQVFLSTEEDLARSPLRRCPGSSSSLSTRRVWMPKSSLPSCSWPGARPSCGSSRTATSTSVRYRAGSFPTRG